LINGIKKNSGARKRGKKKKSSGSFKLVAQKMEGQEQGKTTQQFGLVGRPLKPRGFLGKG